MLGLKLWGAMISLSLFPLAHSPRTVETPSPVFRWWFPFQTFPNLAHILAAYVEAPSIPSFTFATLLGTCFSSATEMEGGCRPAHDSRHKETTGLYGGGTMMVPVSFFMFFLILPNIWFVFWSLLSTGLTFSCNYYNPKILFTSDSNLVFSILHLISR